MKLTAVVSTVVLFACLVGYGIGNAVFNATTIVMHDNARITASVASIQEDTK